MNESWDDSWRGGQSADFGGYPARDYSDAVGGYAEEDELPEPPLFTVTNPPDTVTVSASISGGVHHVELAPSVAKMTERELADEICAVARLASMKAGSVVHAFLVEGMRSSGHDAALISATLSTGLGMPSPEDAAEAASRIFRDRYGYDAE